MGKRERMLWWCEGCHASGVCASDTSVYDAIERLRSNHDSHDIAKIKKHKFSINSVHVERLASDLSEGER